MFIYSGVFMDIQAIITNIVHHLKSFNDFVNHIMISSGYYKNNGRWLKYGKITMRQLNKQAGSVADRVAREKAKRRFLEADDVRAEIARTLGGDLYDFMLDAVVREIDGDIGKQEARVAAIKLAVTDLIDHWGAKGNPWVEMHCRRAVYSDFYLSFVNSVMVARLRDGDYTAKTTANSRSIAFQAERAVRGLADVLGISVTDVHTSMSKYKIVG